MPTSARMKSAGASASAIAAVPITRNAIHAGAPRYITIAKASWQRLTGSEAGQPQEMEILHVALAPAQIAPDEFDQGRRVLLPAAVFLGQHAHLVARAPHQHRFELVVAQHVAAERRPVRQHRQLAMLDEGREPQDRVVAPIRSAIALPARAPSVYERMPSRMPNWKMRANALVAGQAGHERLQDADARLGLHDADQAQHRAAPS